MKKKKLIGIFAFSFILNFLFISCTNKKNIKNNTFSVNTNGTPSKVPYVTEYCFDYNKTSLCMLYLKGTTHHVIKIPKIYQNLFQELTIPTFAPVKYVEANDYKKWRQKAIFYASYRPREYAWKSLKKVGDKQGSNKLFNNKAYANESVSLNNFELNATTNFDKTGKTYIEFYENSLSSGSGIVISPDPIHIQTTPSVSSNLITSSASTSTSPSSLGAPGLPILGHNKLGTGFFPLDIGLFYSPSVLDLLMAHQFASPSMGGFGNASGWENGFDYIKMTDPFGGRVFISGGNTFKYDEFGMGSQTSFENFINTHLLPDFAAVGSSNIRVNPSGSLEPQSFDLNWGHPSEVSNSKDLNARLEGNLLSFVSDPQIKSTDSGIVFVEGGVKGLEGYFAQKPVLAHYLWGLAVGKTLTNDGRPEFSVWSGGKGTILAPGNISGIKKDFSNTGFLPKVAVVPIKSSNDKNVLPTFVREHSEGVDEETKLSGLPIAGDSPFGNGEFRADDKYKKQTTLEGPVSPQLPTLIKEYEQAKDKALDMAIAHLSAMKSRVDKGQAKPQSPSSQQKSQQLKSEAEWIASEIEDKLDEYIENGNGEKATVIALGKMQKAVTLISQGALEAADQKSLKWCDKLIEDSRGTVFQLSASNTSNSLRIPLIKGPVTYISLKSSSNSAEGKAIRELLSKADALEQAADKNQDGAASVLAVSAKIALIQADEALEKGDKKTANEILGYVRSIMDISVGFIPIVGNVHDLIVAYTGYNVITGENATLLERAFAGLGALLPVGGKYVSAAAVGMSINLLNKRIDDLSKVGGKVANAVSDLGAGVKAESKALNDFISKGNATGLDLHDVYGKGLTNKRAGQYLGPSIDKRFSGNVPWESGAKRTAAEIAGEHAYKHAKEFGLTNTDEYIKLANEFLNNLPSTTLTKPATNGAKEFFDPVSNTYIIVSSKGNPISLYKPNLNYINEIAKSNTKYSSTTEWFLKKKN